MERPYLVRSRLREELATELGHMNAAWAALEFTMFRLFFRTTGMPTRLAQAIFYSQRTTHARLTILNAAYQSVLRRKDGLTAEGKRLKKHLDKLQGIATRRNSFVHDPWVARDKVRMGQMILLGSVGASKLEFARTAKVKSLARRIRTFNRKLREITDRVDPKVTSLRGKMPQAHYVDLLRTDPPHPGPQSPKKRAPQRRASVRIPRRRVRLSTRTT